MNSIVRNPPELLRLWSRSERPLNVLHVDLRHSIAARPVSALGLGRHHIPVRAQQVLKATKPSI